jgi:hypothetical protein
MLWQRLVIYLSLVLNFVLWELFFWQPGFLYLWLGLIFLVIFLTNLALLQTSVWTARFWQNFLLPLLYNTALAMFWLFWEGQTTRHYLSILLVIFLGIWWEMLKDTKISQTIVIYFSWLTLFLFFISIYNLIILVGFSFWWLSLICAVFLFLLFWAVGWWWRLPANSRLVYACILTLIFSELFWSLSFWPINLYLSCLVISAVYYLLINLINFKVDKKLLNWSTTKNYFLISGVVILLSLISARWR